MINKKVGQIKLIEGKRHDGVLWIEINCGGRKIFLATVYMVPVGSPYYEENKLIRLDLEKDITEFKKQGIVIITGDFNSRISNLMSITSKDKAYKRNNVDKGENQNGKKLIELMNGLGMIILSGIRKKSKYTCFKEMKGKVRKSVVDHFCIQEGVIDSIIDEDTKDDIMESINTDHAMVSITFKLKIITKEEKQKEISNTNKKTGKHIKQINKITNKKVWEQYEEECQNNKQLK